MSSSLFMALADEVGELVEPLVNAAENPEVLVKLLHVLRIDQAASEPVLTQLNAVAQAYQAIRELEEPGSLAEVAELLNTLRPVFQAVRDLDQLSLAGVTTFGRDLVDWLVIEHLRRRRAGLFGVLQLLGLVRMVKRSRPGGLAASVNVARLDFGKLDDLLREPVPTLRALYFPEGLASGVAADEGAERLFPRLAVLLRELDLETKFGLHEQDLDDLGEAAPLMRRALLVRLPRELWPSADAELGAVVSLSSPDRGDLGVVVSPFGAIDVSREIGDYRVEAGLSAGVDLIHFKDGKAGTQGGNGEVRAHLRAQLLAEEGQPARRVGGATGTRLELGELGAGLELVLSGDDPSYSISLDAGACKLIVEPGEGDGFLRSILPDKGITVPFDLGLAWSNKRGLTLRGGASLETTLPAHLALGPLRVEQIQLALRAQEGELSLDLAARAGLRLGPLTIVLDRVGLRGRLRFPEQGGNLGPADFELAALAPTGIGIAMELPAVSLGGFLFHEPGQDSYAGAVELRLLDKLDLTALGMLTPTPQGLSLLVLVGTRFPTPIHLGYNVYLAGVGGLLGLHRTADVERMRRGLREGSVDHLLFPRDVVANAHSLVTDLAQLFPVRRDQFLVGPTAQLTWNQPALITADVGLILELGSPNRVVLLGALRAAVPKPEEPLLDLKVAFLGSLDLDKGLLSFDASIHDSYIGRGAFKFAFEGDLAFRASWGERKDLVASVGGFHPEYKPPAYLRLADMRRVTVSLLKDNPKLTLSAYFAITTNTVQFGAELDFLFKVKSFKVVGNFGFDALFQFSPFAFTAAVRARLSVKKGSRTLFAISLEFELSGTTPWVAKGKASFRVLFFSVSVRFEKTWGERRQISQPKVALLPLLRAELARSTAWLGELSAGTGQGTFLSGEARSANAGLLDPAGTLTIRQTLAPLGLDITRFGGNVLADVSRVDVLAVKVGPASARVTLNLSEVRDGFAPAAFRELSDRDKLKAASYEPSKSGVAARGKAGYHSSFLLARPVRYERIVSDGSESSPVDQPVAQLRFQQLVGGGSIGRSSASRRIAVASQAKSVRALGLAEERFAVVLVDSLRAVDEASTSMTRAHAEERLRTLNGSPLYDIVPSYQRAA